MAYVSDHIFFFFYNQIKLRKKKTMAYGQRSINGVMMY
jgi:hypothetical protein